MNICFMKKIVLFVSVLLLVIGLAGIYATRPPDECFLKQAWGVWTGPCKKVNDHCGGAGGGTGTCKLDPTIPWCSGVCPAYCPSGPPDYICQRVSGSCNHAMVTCSIMRRYTCRMDAHGLCYCDESGTGVCPRQTC